MPLGFSVEERVKILVVQVTFQRDVALPKHFDSKISDKSIATANGEPQEISLLLATCLDQKFKFTLAQ
ncbi:hypothetical protein D3C77_776700 [compost metagenome]